MRKTRPRRLTDEQEGLTAHEAFMAEALKHPQASEQQAAPKPKPRWLLFLESAGGVALITVLLGGIFGSAVAAIVQRYQKDREYQQAILKTRSELELAAAKEYRDRELELVGQAYELLGRCITASDDLIYLTSPAFDPRDYEDPTIVRTQWREMVNAYNECAKDWRGRREKLRLLMSYYQQGRSEVVLGWQDVQDSATTYMGCAHQWFMEHSKAPAEIEEACKAERQDYSEKVRALNSSFSAARQNLWEEWKLPQ